MLSVDLGEASHDVYSPRAAELLARDDVFVVMGAEDLGTPQAILDRTESLIMIPCLSASINVSCAFMVVLTVMITSRRNGQCGKEPAT